MQQLFFSVWPKFGNFEEIQKNDFLDHAQPENCGGIKFYKVKKHIYIIV